MRERRESQHNESPQLEEFPQIGAAPSDDGRLPDAAFDRRDGGTAVYERAATGVEAAIVSPLKER